MMTTKTAGVCLLATAVVAVCGCQTSKTTVSSWDYKVVEKNLYENELQKQIDAAARDGWEFVSLSTAGQGESSVPKGFIVFKKLRR